MTQSFVLGYANPADASRGDTALVTVDGIGLLVQPVSVSGGGSAETLIFANIAAMSAYVKAGTQDGQPAAVESNGSVWALRTTAATSDNITIANSTFAGMKWVRSGSYITAVAQAQTAWFVDPQNVSGTASDENTGLDATHAILTKAEMMRRWGYTWSPDLDGIIVNVQYLSADTLGDGSGHDPGLFTPNLKRGAQLRHFAALPAAGFTGTINVATPKSRAGNQALNCSFVTTTGAVGAGMLLVNTTRGNSRAFARVNTGGGVWQISQPLAPYVAGTFPNAVEVDTWANGDAIQGFQLLQVDLARIGGALAQFDASFLPGHTVQNIDIADPTGLGAEDPLTIDGACAPLIVECQCQRAANMQGGSTDDSCNFQNVAWRGLVWGTSNALNVIVIEGGYADQDLVITIGAALGADFIVGGPGNSLMGFGTCVNVYVDTGSSLFAQGLCALGIIYGLGNLDTSDGTWRYNGPASTALPISSSGGLRIGGGTHAYSNATSAGVVAVHQLATISAAQLDAAAGAAGYGGLAYVPGLGAYSAGTVP